MAAIPESQAKTQYFFWKGEIIGYSLKVASTAIYHLTYGKDRRQRARAPRIGQAEALNAKKRGTPVNLWVRHPFDRLVSGYIFFTQRHTSYISPILEASKEDHDIILGNTPATIEEWHAATQRHYNAHWISQWDYHSRDGQLVPNVLWPMESLQLVTERHNATERKSWEEYLSPEFLADLEKLYAKDIELYEQAKEEWNGQAPRILQSAARVV